jgi:hypothetical protein
MGSSVGCAAVQDVVQPFFVLLCMNNCELIKKISYDLYFPETSSCLLRQIETTFREKVLFHYQQV